MTDTVDAYQEAPLIRIPENPLPPELKVRFLKADDGARIRIAMLPHEAPRGTVLVHPGWSEFLEKYIEVAGDLHRRGFNIMMMDPRGQGYSQRVLPTDTRGLITDFRRFTEDLQTVFDEMCQFFDGPYYVLAHSMGGLITLEWLAIKRPTLLKGVVLNAPFTRLFAHRLKRAIVRTITRSGMLFGGAKWPLSAAPEHSMSFETNTLTQDARRHERFRLLQVAAPEAIAGPPKVGWLNAALAAQERIDQQGALKDLPVPVLIVSAERDETVDPSHHHILSDRYSEIDLVDVPGARHEILMEQDQYRDQFWDAFDTYIDNVNRR